MPYRFRTRTLVIGIAIVATIVALLGWQWWTQRSTEEDLRGVPGYVERVPLDHLVATGDYEVIDAVFDAWTPPDRFSFIVHARVDTTDGTYLNASRRVALLGNDAVIVTAAEPDAPLDAAAAFGALPAGNRIHIGIQASRVGESVVHVYHVIITDERP